MAESSRARLSSRRTDIPVCHGLAKMGGQDVYPPLRQPTTLLKSVRDPAGHDALIDHQFLADRHDSRNTRGRGASGRSRRACAASGVDAKPSHLQFPAEGITPITPTMPLDSVAQHTPRGVAAVSGWAGCCLRPNRPMGRFVGRGLCARVASPSTEHAHCGDLVNSPPMLAFMVKSFLNRFLIISENVDVYAGRASRAPRPAKIASSRSP